MHMSRPNHICILDLKEELTLATQCNEQNTNPKLDKRCAIVGVRSTLGNEKPKKEERLELSNIKLDRSACPAYVVDYLMQKIFSYYFSRSNKCKSRNTML